VQGYLNGEKSCPDYYKKLIHINLREELQKSDPDTKRRDSPKNYGQKSFDLSDEKKVQQLIKLYNKGETLKNIGEVFGMSHGSVINYVKRLKDRGVDIERRGQGKQSSYSKSFDLSDEKQVQQFIKLYNEGENLTNIGKVFGISKSSVRNYIQRLKDKGVDIDFRGQGSQRKTANSLDLSDERKVRRFIRMYQDGHTLDAIGDTFDMTAPSVRNYIQRLKDKGVEIDFRGQGRRTDNLYPDHKRKRSVNLNKEKSSNKKLLNIMNNQKRS
jgi:biotin operon repressor